jgi:hypothetical protein
LRPRPRLESAGVASAAAALPSPRVACETCVAWGIEPRTTRVARGPRTTRGVRACGAGGGGKRGRRRLTDEKGAVAIAVVAVEGVPRRRTVTSGADVEHNVLPMVFLRCSVPPPVRDLTASRTYPSHQRRPPPWPCRRIHTCEEGEKGRGDRMGRRGRGGGRLAWEGEGEERSRPRGRRGVATSPCPEDSHAG